MPGTNKTLGGGGIHHVAVRVKDFDRSHRFYTEALGFKERLIWGEGRKRCCLLDTGDGNYLELQGGDEPPPGGAILHIAIRTDDCDAAIERVRKAGAEITVEPKSVDIQGKPGPVSVRIGFFKGPDGEMIEFFQNTAT